VRRGRACDPRAEPQALTVAEAFAGHVGVDLGKILGSAGAPDRAALAAEASRVGVAFGPEETWSDIFSRILVERIEPHLGLLVPTLLFEYPLSEAALARPCAHDPRYAERFELYVAGVELANGYGELIDPAEQRRRFEAEMTLKESRYGERWPIDEELLAALAEMPPTSGVALGFDRLVMLAAGARRIDDVQWSSS
jgi:lysyl-tRNA synthetase class 2